MTSKSLFSFDNTYAAELEGLYVRVEPAGFPNPELVAFNKDLAESLSLDVASLQNQAASILSGNTHAKGSEPIAQAYAGHQFGSFSGLLGDGRALLLGEVVDRDGARQDIQLKGSGRTPFSRGGDGKAVLGPILREYLVSEAMHRLGIPTSRILVALRTGESVVRGKAQPGAVLTRVASSHIRVGTFELFAATQEHEKLKRLAEYTIKRHYPENADAEHPNLALLESVGRTQGELVARWMLVGFVHGVMNTDNVAVSGRTIDYGPCAFMEAFDPATVFSSIDHGGRYAYGNQSSIGQWNTLRFASALLSLEDEAKQVADRYQEVASNSFVDAFRDAWLDGMRKKLGLTTKSEDDAELAQGLLQLLADHNVDYTRAMRSLSESLKNDSPVLKHETEHYAAFEAWGAWWKTKIADTSDAISLIEENSPMYIPRNHKVEEALVAAADHDDMKPFEAMMEVAMNPFEARDEWHEYALPAPPESEPYKTFCGT